MDCCRSRAAAGRRPPSVCSLPFWHVFALGAVLRNVAVTCHASNFQRPQVPLTHIPIDYGDEDQHRGLQDTSAYQPIRITFDTRVLDSVYGMGNTDVDGKIDYIRREILPAMQAKWSSHLLVRPLPSAIPVGPDICFGEYGNILTTTIAYDNTDLVVVVGGDPGQICGDNTGTLAYAFPCGLDTLTDRPIVGTFNFCLNTITTSEIIGGNVTLLERLGGQDLPLYYSVYTNQKFQPNRLGISIKDVAVHEVTHIFGFSFLLYPYFRDDFGNPRTPRDSSTGEPIPLQRACGNGTVITGVLPSEQVIQVRPSPWDPSRWEHYIVTERVQRLTQMLFNCSSLIGARLEDSDNCYGSHWHERDFYSELLSPVVSEGTENVLSYLTLAFLEDTGWYLVDYRGSKFPSFGLLAGCDFVNEACINSTTGEARVVKGATNEFCTTPLLVDGTGVPVVSSLNSVICDPAYESWTICDLSNVRPISPNELLYFPDPSWTTVAFPNADNCPIPSLQLGLQCSNEDSSTYTVFYDGESVGTGSRCVNAYYNRGSSGRAYQPACMSVTCDADAGLVRLGSNYVCTYDGEELPILNRSDGATIICPRLAAVCPELFTCPDGCFGRGECVYSGSGRPTCRCFDGNNTHASCAPAMLLNRPTTGPTTPAPVTSVSGGGGRAPSAPVTAIKQVASPRRAPIPAPVVAQSGATQWERSSLFAGMLLSGWYLIG